MGHGSPRILGEQVSLGGPKATAATLDTWPTRDEIKRHVLVLGSWLVGGAVLFGVAVRRERSRSDVEMSERRIEAAFGEERVRT